MTTHILDTQIISYAIKGAMSERIQGALISSITATEFLLIQGKNHHSANYYAPLPSSLIINVEDALGVIPKREHPFTKNTTDSVILDFKQDHPPIILYSNLAISEIINKKLSNLLREAVRFLDKKQQKTIKARFAFLIEHDLQCVPVTRKIAPIGLDLLGNFTTQYNPKDNFRNTVNDVLIFASALVSSSILITKDNLLNRFAAEYYGAQTTIRGDILEINLQEKSRKEEINRRESKGYINRGWQFSLRNHRNANI